MWGNGVWRGWDGMGGRRLGFQLLLWQRNWDRFCGIVSGFLSYLVKKAHTSIV